MYKLTQKNENYEEAIRLLNETAYDFYSNKILFKDESYPMFLKSLLLSYINTIERVLRNTFVCDLYLDRFDLYTFQEMFPRVNRIFDVSNIKKRAYLGKLLGTLRNINAHYSISEEDQEILNKPCYNIPNRHPFNGKIKTIDNKSRLTVGGVIFLIMLFLRDKQIKHMAFPSKLCGLVACGRFTNQVDGKDFNSAISKTKLDVPIRKIQGNTIRTAIIGEYIDFIDTDYPQFQYEHIVCKQIIDIKFKIDDDLVIIERNSVCKTYYKNRYELKVIDVDGFIELSNQLPPFSFVGLLYKLGICCFDKKEYQEIKEKFDSVYLKLNYPKHYSDKNLDSLLLPQEIADDTIVSISVNESINTIFLNLEKRLSMLNNQENEGIKYSELKEELNKLGVDKSTKDSLLIIRNASFHGYKLNECYKTRTSLYQYTMDLVASSFYPLLKFLNQNGMDDIYEALQKDIDKILVERLIKVKYNKIIEYSVDGFNGHPVFDNTSQQSKNKLLYPESSCYDISTLKQLYYNKPVPLLVLKFTGDDFDEPIYIKNEAGYLTLLEEFLNKTNNKYNKVLKEDFGLVQHYELIKQTVS